jgi:hypothetical protein
MGSVGCLIAATDCPDDTTFALVRVAALRISRVVGTCDTRRNAASQGRTIAPVSAQLQHLRGIIQVESRTKRLKSWKWER